ncbi:MAG: single-stranded DNA-binding protein [Chitinophagales bacterium]|nr:single-stranded DNA-binding protein [Chitinophagales bacterium]MDW8428810.1 single-stranded DNA-binding protein [Chitinophagales bacterium]
MNKVILIGNLGKEPDVRRPKEGSVVAHLWLATTEYFRTRDGNRSEHTEWHNVVLWNRWAEIAEKYLHKGSTVLVEGRIRSREFTDKNNNQQRAYEIVATSLMMLDRRGNGTPPDAQESAADIVEEADDLPF